MAELIERIAFEAREDKRVDRRSGVSQRLPISVLDNVLSNAERRTIATKEKHVVPRISDVYAALPRSLASSSSSTKVSCRGRRRSPRT